MFLKMKTMKSTEDNSNNIEKLKQIINSAEAILIGAGAGLSTSAGLSYSGERFEQNFSEYIEEYGFSDMYSATFYPYNSLEEYWGYMSKHIYINRYENNDNGLYEKLYNIVKDKNYFVLTTNVDHKFQKAGFNKDKLFYTQGDYGLWQCSVPCHKQNYDNEDLVKQMIDRQVELKIPTDLVPLCPKCNKPMSMNLRCDDTFVEDEGWFNASKRYAEFVKKYSDSKILFLELGVGSNTPSIIKYPFWKMTMQNEKATYCCINFGESTCLEQIEKQSICIDEDIKSIIDKI